MPPGVDSRARGGLPYSHERLHEAACWLGVDADLQVKIECHRHGDATAAPRPGEPADVTVTTCDAQGKPVAAEVSLAMLPADRRTTPRPWPTNRWPVSSAAAVARRNSETASSIQFHYQPANRVIGTAEPEETSPAVPPHIAPQQGIRVAKPAENGLCVQRSV